VGFSNVYFELKFQNGSVLMTPKLKEMDDVIRRVYAAVTSLQDNSDRTLLVCDPFVSANFGLLSVDLLLQRSLLLTSAGDRFEVISSSEFVVITQMWA
jgi:hypothetical protein